MHSNKALAGRLKKIVRNNSSPDSLEDFLNDQASQQGILNQNKDVPLEENLKGYKREEFRLPILLAEKLRLVSYKLNKKKTDIVQEALLDYFNKLDK